MSATSPTAAPADTALTWASAPAEYRRSAYVGLATRALTPVLSLIAFAWALSLEDDKIAMLTAAICVTVLTIASTYSGWKYHQTTRFVLPSEHKVKVPRALGVPAKILSELGDLGFIFLLLTNDSPFAIQYTILTCVLGGTGLWTTLYKKGSALRAWSAVVRIVATFTAVAVLAPEHFVATAAWSMGSVIVGNALLLCGDAMDGVLKDAELHPWAVRVGGALERRYATEAA
jgi:hypothetical protein